MTASILADKFEDTDWDFKGIRKQGAHQLGKYPATMVAPMQFELLSRVVKGNPHFNSLLDPFMGSGTTLVEGGKLGLEVTGIDINPYAVLLTEVKTHKYDREKLQSAINLVIKKIESPYYSYMPHMFPNIDKWFKKDIKDSLSKIRGAIIEERNIWERKFLWICFSEVIYLYSNDRTSTFKLHIKKKDDVKKIVNKCFDSLKKIMWKNMDALSNNKKRDVTILSGDSKVLLSNMASNSVDIICTSPPYGDNGTTVTYGQASILFLKWIFEEDLRAETKLLSNYSAIDSASLGSKETSDSFKKLSSAVNYISLLSENKKKKVEKFISAYFNTLVELEKVLRPGGYILFTVGNRRVDGEIQPLDKITEETFVKLGLIKETSFTRNIYSKKMPIRISKVKDKGAVLSMNEETVLIFRKEDK